MNILILCGHGNDNGHYDPGASGCGFIEAKETIRYGHKIAEELRKYKNINVDVYEGNMYRYLIKRGQKYDFKKYDYVLDCHLNAATSVSAHGSEIFVTSLEKTISVEKAIMQKLKKYFTLRDNDSIHDGVKRYNWGVIYAIKKNSQVSCALLELCFITNKEDMAIYQKSFDSICYDIAFAIAIGFGCSQKENSENISKTMYRVRSKWDAPASQVGAYEVLENAINKANETGLSVFDSVGSLVYSPTKQYKEHQLKTNDTLWSLAVQYLGSGTKWKEIQDINPGLNPQALPVGKIIKIPLY